MGPGWILVRDFFYSVYASTIGQIKNNFQNNCTLLYIFIPESMATIPSFYFSRQTRHVQNLEYCFWEISPRYRHTLKLINVYIFPSYIQTAVFAFVKDKKVGCWRRWHSLLQKSQPKLFGLWWDSKCISRSTFNSNVWYHSLHECRGILCLSAFDGKLGWARLTESLKMSQLVFLSFAVFSFLQEGVSLWF
jgi:hypothetical protein